MTIINDDLEITCITEDKKYGNIYGVKNHHGKHYFIIRLTPGKNKMELKLFEIRPEGKQYARINVGGKFGE